MNSTNMLPEDLASLPYDPIDGMIAALDHAVPIFDDRRLDRGVNTRYCWAFASLLESEAQRIELTTQYTRRKQIIPATPKLSILKETAVKAAGEIDFLHQQECAPEDKNANGRRFLARISQGHIRGLLKAISRLESNWGSFYIWVQRPALATCESLIRAAQKGETDFEDYLAWFCKHEMKVEVGWETDDFNRLKAYVVHVLLGTRTFGGRLWLPGDMSELVGVPDHELLPKLLSAAKFLLRKDENTEADRVRLQVEKTESGKVVRRYGDSLQALQERGIEIVCDPWEILLSSDTPIKLANWQDAAQEAEQSRPMNIVLDGIKWSQEEASYVRLHCIYGVSHAECQERLGMDDRPFNALRRRVDKRLRAFFLKAALQKFKKEPASHLQAEDFEHESIPRRHGPVRVLMKDGISLKA